jgi:HPt (histidine-containing phosphotransfer) domain-containing protein
VSVINRAKLTAVLQMSQQHQAQLLQMISNMIDDAEPAIAKIQLNVKQQQRLELQQTLHKIRGGYATLGAEKLALESKALEQMLENNLPFSDADTAEFITLYRQTCAEMRTEIALYQQDSAPQQQPLNVNRLYTMLMQHDMQACQLVQSSQKELSKVLAPSEAASFTQHVAALEFVSAARMLEPHLTSNRRIP